MKKLLAVFALTAIGSLSAFAGDYTGVISDSCAITKTTLKIGCLRPKMHQGRR